jgi:hypothetical protein
VAWYVEVTTFRCTLWLPYSLWIPSWTSVTVMLNSFMPIGFRMFTVVTIWITLFESLEYLPKLFCILTIINDYIFLQYTSFRYGKDDGAYKPSYTSCLCGCLYPLIQNYKKCLAYIYSRNKTYRNILLACCVLIYSVLLYFVFKKYPVWISSQKFSPPTLDEWFSCLASLFPGSCCKLTLCRLTTYIYVYAISHR